MVSSMLPKFNIYGFLPIVVWTFFLIDQLLLAEIFTQSTY